MNFLNHSPRVSIIVPNYNGEKFIAETLLSLKIQTYKNFEIIFVDDGSTDHSIQIFNELNLDDNKMRLLSSPRNLGESSAINMGWRVATGELVSIVSSDDPQEIDWLANMVKFILTDPKHLFYYPNLRVIDNHGVILDEIELYDWSRELIFRKLICIASAGTIINRSLLPEDYILRTEKIIYPSDLFQFLELSKIGSGIRVKNSFGVWRQHSESTSYNINQIARAQIFVRNVEDWISNNKFLYDKWTSFQISKFNIWIQALTFINFDYTYMAMLRKLNFFFVKRFFNPLFIAYLLIKIFRKHMKMNNVKRNIVARMLKSIIFLNLLRVFNRIYLSVRKVDSSYVSSANSIEAFWDLSHKNGSKFSLTGTNFDWLTNYHNLNITKNTKVLNVGVGTGDCTRGISKLTPYLDVLDISKTALDNVSNEISRGFLNSELSLIPSEYYDCVIHHLVAQHMSILSLRIQTKYLINSLAPGGILYIQIASYLDTRRNDNFDSDTQCMAGSVGRSIEEIELLFNSENIQILELTHTHTFWKYGSIWYRLKIRKNGKRLIELG